MRDHVRATAADRPGIYRMIAADGEVVYVGKSKRVRTRLLSYFRASFPAEKGARIVREAASIEWEYVPSEFAALLAEMRAIKRDRPRLNVAMKRDARHFAFIKLTRGMAPKLLAVRGPSGDDSAIYYGPFHGARQLQESLRELSDVLGLRDCRLTQRVVYADQAELFDAPARTPGCIRLEIGRCLGPCAGACTAAAYAERVRMARAYLDGENDGPVETLRADMEASAGRLEFERAASLRDKLGRLETLREQFARLRFAIESLSFAYHVPGFEGDDRVYLIRRGRVRGERPAPRTRTEQRALKVLKTEVFGAADPIGARVPTHEIDELMLLSSWFRAHPEQMKHTRRP
ncbi:MAG: UvrB/UvrC motif-containing protein [Gemmatimonadaceae bacterium]|nr:UvrB/UvrC motif-containing protein [Gemmatimonadaceae bacterium]